MIFELNINMNISIKTLLNCEKLKTNYSKKEKTKYLAAREIPQRIKNDNSIPKSI